MKNVEKVFEMLGVKPYEIFTFDNKTDQYHIDEKLKVWMGSVDDGCIGVVQHPSVVTLLLNPNKIKKLPPKPLLTNEEKEFLKNFMFDSLKKVKGRAIIFYIVTNGGCSYTLGLNALKLRFNGLEFDKEYTKEELGLKENNVLVYFAETYLNNALKFINEGDYEDAKNEIKWALRKSNMKIYKEESNILPIEEELKKRNQK